MSKRRTHSSVDKLPTDLRDSLMRMIVDNEWPDDFRSDTEPEGKPQYDDLVAYCTQKDQSVSRSAIARWAKQLRTFERMRTAGAIARDVMQGLSEENATVTQKAAAEIITAQIIELTASEDMTTKQIKDVSTAIRDCTAVAMKADQYVRKQIEEKARTADKKIVAIAKKKQIDPETLKAIREQVYGIFK